MCALHLDEGVQLRTGRTQRSREDRLEEGALLGGCLFRSLIHFRWERIRISRDNVLGVILSGLRSAVQDRDVIFLIELFLELVDREAHLSSSLLRSL